MILMLSALLAIFSLKPAAHAADPAHNPAVGFQVPGFELVVTQPVSTPLTQLGTRGPVEVWKEMINGAKKRIDFEQMYASGKAGEPLEEILSSLEDAAKRGVKIRFLLEEKMQNASIPETVERLKKIPGLELRFIRFGALTGDGIVHAKTFIVDGDHAFVGSQNFDWRALKHINETGLRITDKKIAGQVQQIFDFDWKAADLEKKGQKVKALPLTKAADGKERAYLVASPPNFLPKGISASEPELVRLLNNAKTEIRVQLLDYYPLRRDKSFYPVIDNAVRAAIARHVKVKLLVSHWNLGRPGVDHLKSLAVLPDVEIRVTTIPNGPEGKIPFGRVMHSKVMTIDGQLAWVGTSNWTGGYLDQSRNLELVVKDAALAGKLNDLYDQIWNAPFTAPIDVMKTYDKPEKGAE